MTGASLGKTVLRFLKLVFATRSALIGVSAVVFVLTSIALAQTAPEIKCDLKKEQTIKGTVVEVKKLPKAIGTHDAIHLMVKTDTGDVEVEVGPVAFLDEMDISFKPGDKVTIIASSCKQDSEVLAAREITQGENDTLTLRDHKGDPVWTWMIKKG
jgi:hypothetical protein